MPTWTRFASLFLIFILAAENNYAQWVFPPSGGGGGAPSGAAGGVLSGTYPDPGFASAPTFTGPVTITSGGGVAGTLALSQGTAPALVANQAQFIAPTSVAVGGVQFVIPGTSGSGMLYDTVAGGQDVLDRVPETSFAYKPITGNIVIGGTADTEGAMFSVLKNAPNGSGDTALFMGDTYTYVRIKGGPSQGSLPDFIIERNNGDELFSVGYNSGFVINDAPNNGGGINVISASSGYASVYWANAAGDAGLGQINSETGSLVLNNAGMYGWAAGTTVPGSTETLDTGIARNAAGVMEVNNGSACSTAANCSDLILRSVVGRGTAPGVATCGTIGTGSTNIAGFITSDATGSCVSVVTMTATAPVGWSCAISNATTANIIRQTGSSTTTATFTGVTATNDVLRYACFAY